jgi:carbonic anhydrase
VLEYGVRVLKVKHVVVLGHEQCGGVQAMVEGAPAEATDFVEPWMKIADSVARSIPPQLPKPDVLNYCEEAVVRLSLANLTTFPWIRDGVAEGRLSLHGFRFAVRTGILTRLQGDRFVPID